MTYVFTWDLRVRTYECDLLGHVNNAVYQQYLQEAAIEAATDGRRPDSWPRAKIDVEGGTSCQRIRPTDCTD